MLVRCINNKDFEHMLTIDYVYNVNSPLQNYTGFVGFFVELPNKLSVYFAANRFEVCK